MLRIQAWLRILLTLILALLPVVAVQAPAQAAGAVCAAASYLPNTTSYPNNDPGTLTNDKYLLSGNIYYKVNKTSAEAIAVGYVRSFTGALTIPENLLITATEIQAAGFDSNTANCSAFAMSYKVRYVGPSAFIAGYNTTAPVLSAINIEANLKVIGREAFVAQCKVETLVIPDSVTDIGKTAFGGMNSITGVLKNDNCSYAANDGLKSITLGVNLKRFYDTAFNQSQRINSVTFRGEPLSSSPGDFPIEYDLWNTGARNYLVGGAINNTCTINFTYVFNLSVRILADSRANWTPWALANNCFTQVQINAFTADITTSPAKPAAPVASNPTQTTADVTFAAPTTNGGSAITSYIVTSVPGGLTATSAGSAGATVTVSGLTPATSYKFFVSAINAAGTSTPSELSNAVVTSALTAPDITLSSISETATAGSAISGYTISNTGGPVANYSINPGVSNGLSFNTNTGVLTGVPSTSAIAVAYTITANNGAGSDTAIFTITVLPAPTPPAPVIPTAASPTSLVAVPDLTSAAITWTASAAAATYKLYLGEFLAATVGGDTTATTLNGLTKNTKYALSIVASNSAAESKATSIDFTTDNLVTFTVRFSGDSSVISKSQLAKFDVFISKIQNLNNARASVIGSVKKTARATGKFDRSLASARAKIVFSRLAASGLPSSNSVMKALPATKSLDSERRAVIQVLYDQN